MPRKMNYRVHKTGSRFLAAFLAVSLLGFGSAARADSIPTRCSTPTSRSRRSSAGLVSRSASSSSAPNDLLVLEKASGQVKRVDQRRHPADAGARPGGELELRARALEHGPAPEFPGDALRLHPLDREQHGGGLGRRARRPAAGQPARPLRLERRPARSRSTEPDPAALPPDRQRRRARSSRHDNAAGRPTTTAAC